jgi:hypothetical protein
MTVCYCGGEPRWSGELLYDMLRDEYLYVDRLLKTKLPTTLRQHLGGVSIRLSSYLFKSRRLRSQGIFGTNQTSGSSHLRKKNVEQLKP